MIKNYIAQIVHPESDICPHTGRCLDSVYEIPVKVKSGPGEVFWAYLLADLFSPPKHWVACVWCPDDTEEDDEF